MVDDDPKLSLKDEMERARTLEKETFTDMLVSRTHDRRIALCCLVLALIGGVVAIMSPSFKKPPPPELVLIRLNEATNEIENISKLANAQEDYGERVARHFLQLYVRKCESFDWNTIQLDYNACGLLSSPAVQREYEIKVRGKRAKGNSESTDPGWLRTYADRTKVRIAIRAITLGPKQTATVRFTRRFETVNQVDKTEQAVATVAYRYINSPLSRTEGLDNPLGFQVLSYRTDPEIER